MLVLQPMRAEALHSRSLAHINLGAIESAISDLTNAIQIDPNMTIAYGDRAAAYMRKKDYEKAVSDSSMAIGLDENYTSAYLNRGISLFHLSEYSGAIEDYDQVLLLESDRVDVYAHLARAYTMLGIEVKVQENLQQLTDRDVDITELSNELNELRQGS